MTGGDLSKSRWSVAALTCALSDMHRIASCELSSNMGRIVTDYMLDPKRFLLLSVNNSYIGVHK